MARQVKPTLDWKEIKQRASQFILNHKNDSIESAEKQTFWNDFFNIFGVPRQKVAVFEQEVDLVEGGRGFIDVFWKGVLLVEHKTLGKNLDEAYNQALGYCNSLSSADAPKYVVVSDFHTFRFYDLTDDSRYEFTIEQLNKDTYIRLFGFIAGYESRKTAVQDPVNIKAAEQMAKLHDQLKDAGYVGHDLEQYLTRLVFCMFAEDTGIFDKNQFVDFISATNEDGSNLASDIATLFQVLNTPNDRRMTTIGNRFGSFPYVNGGLFKDVLPVAGFNAKMRKILIECTELDWSGISPAIFGSLFQGVMDPMERRELGAHYTSEENILKAINPLFMDDLRKEFESIRSNKNRLNAFWDKLSRIRVLDPACGCGNFLIISYRELRLLEIDVISAIYEGQTTLDVVSKIHVNHFYGMEIEDFPVEIARVAMWLMDHLMNMKVNETFGTYCPSIPLEASANIRCCNSLKTDWDSMIAPGELTYIVGNPPFIGFNKQSDEQKMDMLTFFTKYAGTLDYVSAWYVKATDMMTKNPSIRSAFVSTNSITQGEQVKPLWEPLMKRGLHINFAYQTFKWKNEAKGNAGVHVVIIGITLEQPKICTLYYQTDTGVMSRTVKHINGYLTPGPDVFISNRTKPICDVPPIGMGCQPIDGGHYIFTKEGMTEFIEKEPDSAQFFKKYYGATEFLNNKPRYCLYLGEVPASELRKLPNCMDRINKVRQHRLNSDRKQTKKYADKPTQFYSKNIPKETYVVIPEVSGERREYIPMGFMKPDVLCSNKLRLAPNSTLYHFGVLQSKIHMLWADYVGGKLEKRFDYSINIVYNNFPWPKATDEQKEHIGELAQAVLDARAKYEGQSLADLYDPLTMPPDLLDAHRKLDAAVEKLYGKKFKDDNERIALLFEMYLQYTEPGHNIDTSFFE